MYLFYNHMNDLVYPCKYLKKVFLYVPIYSILMAFLSFVHHCIIEISRSLATVRVYLLNWQFVCLFVFFCSEDGTIGTARWTRIASPDVPTPPSWDQSCPQPFGFHGTIRVVDHLGVESLRLWGKKVTAIERAVLLFLFLLYISFMELKPFFLCYSYQLATYYILVCKLPNHFHK